MERPGRVQVTATKLDTGLTRITTSESEGRFVFPGLPVGVYELRAELNGFEPLVFPNVRLRVNETTDVSLVMKVSRQRQTSTINSGEALVNTQTPELSYLVGEQAIRELPLNGRNYTDLAFLQPGVIPYSHRDGGSVVAHGLGMSVNGQDPRSNVYLLDGTPQNDLPTVRQAALRARCSASRRSGSFALKQIHTERSLDATPAARSTPSVSPAPTTITAAFICFIATITLTREIF